MDEFIEQNYKKIILYIITIIILLWAYFSFMSPYLNVWQQSMAGQAELSHAEFNRQIAICEAMAKKESAKFLSESEIIRAEGVAQANKIIGDSLTGNEGYLRYLWIQGLQTNNMSVVYIPTEANLPILEANRWTEEQRIRGH